MSIETATYIDSLVATNPAQEDPVSEGDNHLRLIKQVLKSTFPGLGIFGGLSNALDAAQGDAYVAVKSALANTVARTQHQKNAEVINCHNIIANNCGDSGITAWYGSRVNAFGGFSSNNTKHGVYAAYNSQIGFNEGTAQTNGQMGVYAFSGSTIDCESAIVSNNSLRNIYAQDASTINAKAATATGAGSRGVFAINSSRINAENVVCTGAVDYGIIASSGSNINAQAANARKGGIDDPTDITVTGGSYINANSSTGGLSVTKNTVTLAGIIHKL